MATPSDQLDQLISTTFDKVKPVLSDQITKETSLLAALNSRSRVTEDGGLTIRRPLMYALNDTVKSYSGYDLIDTTPQDGFGYAEYQYRDFAGSLTIDGDTIRKNSGSAQIINLLQAKMDQLRLSIEDKLDSMLFADGSGNGGKDLLGLAAIIDDSGVLGGIDSSTEDWWKSVVVNDPVDLTTTDGVKVLNNVYNTLGLNRSKIDFEFTTQDNFEAYEALALPNIRFSDLRMAELGFQTIAHKGAEVIFESRSPQPEGSGGGYWYFINSDHLEFVQHRDAWMSQTEFVRPYNQDAKVMLVISMGQLITDNRRAHGVIKETVVSE